TYDDGYDGHGTHNASFAAGNTSGVAKNAKILSLRVQGPDGPSCGEHANGAAIVAAIRWLNDHIDRPAVINVSLALREGDPGFQDLLAAVHDSIVNHQLTYTLSAGTSGSVESHWGAQLPAEALIVAGTDRNDRALSGEYGAALTLFAPAKGMIGAGGASPTAYSIPENCCGRSAGDSFAAPIVAGVAATYLGAHRAATPSEVRQAIIDAASKIPSIPKPLVYSRVGGGTR